MNKIDRLKNILNKPGRRIIGLMSGMSMDGVDLALVDVSGTFPDLKISLLDSSFSPYNDDIKSQLREIVQGKFNEISKYNVIIGEVFAQCVLDFLKDRKIDPESIDAISSHGQTVFHDTREDSLVPSTLQIGSGSIIAERTNILTVHNFRARDIAVGGQGAPLVPLVDYLLYHEAGKVAAYNNLGSISNVTVIPDDINNVYAFDTGPANMPIDYFSRLVLGDVWGFDKDSVYSTRGKVSTELLEEVLSHPFFQKAPPKALGFGEFGPDYLSGIANKYPNLSPYDFVRTALEITAMSISHSYKKFILTRSPQLDKIVFTGGGSKNSLLMERIRDLLPEFVVESMNDERPEFSDAKEALAFAVLANELLSGREGNLPNVTGAQKTVFLGDISV